MNQPEVFKGSSNHYLSQTPGKPLPESPKTLPTGGENGLPAALIMRASHKLDLL